MARIVLALDVAWLVVNVLWIAVFVWGLSVIRKLWR